MPSHGSPPWNCELVPVHTVWSMTLVCLDTGAAVFVVKTLSTVLENGAEALPPFAMSPPCNPPPPGRRPTKCGQTGPATIAARGGSDP